MYKINRTADKVIILDWQGKVVYSADKDSILLYESGAGVTSTNKIAEMSDEQLLIALSQAIRLSF
jgi:hypothetical protein